MWEDFIEFFIEFNTFIAVILVSGMLWGFVGWLLFLWFNSLYS